MSKKGLIIAGVITLILMVAMAIGAYSSVSSKISTKINETQNKQDELQQKISQVKNDQDSNGHTPSDVVKYFINEVKFGDTAKAKLYLTAENQGLDLEKSLGFDVSLDELVIKDVTYEVKDDDMLVKFAYSSGADSINSVKYFTVTNVESTWKIAEIKEG